MESKLELAYKEVFKNMTDGFSFDKVCEEIKNIAYLNKGIHFIITNINIVFNIF